MGGYPSHPAYGVKESTEKILQEATKYGYNLVSLVVFTCAGFVVVLPN